MCISNVQQMNGNSIEFSLSTQTRRVIKLSQAKSLQVYLDDLLLQGVFYTIGNINFPSIQD